MSDPPTRRARAEDSHAVAALFRRSRRTALPYLPDLHTAEEDRAFFRDRVFAECEVWAAERDGVLAGFCAVRDGWIDHLYVDPDRRRRGFGRALLRRALAGRDAIRLWTFQRNAGARAFYEAHGFVLERLTDGRDNEEREPDALYAWFGGSSRPTRTRGAVR